MKLPTLTYLDLSTKHITAEDSYLLSDGDVCDEAGLVAYECEYGWFVPISDEQDWVAVKQAGFSSAFAELIEMCQEQKINLLRLDCDAPDVEGLPEFEW